MWQYGLQTTNRFGTTAKRLIRCCELNTLEGVFLKIWRCKLNRSECGQGMKIWSERKIRKADERKTSICS